MAVQINIAAAKARLSELVARAEAGEEVVIARDGRPVVTLTPHTPSADQRRPLGLWSKYCADLPEDLFIGPDPETLAAVAEWENKSFDPDQ